MTTATIKERPILFTDDNVRAILEGRKTQTRRIIKPQPFEIAPDYRAPGLIRFRETDPCLSTWDNACPYGGKGERIWVRETWGESSLGKTIYRSSPAEVEAVAKAERWVSNPRWRPSIHMPRGASRILLEITRVQVERIQAISAADAVREGRQKRKHIRASVANDRVIEEFRERWDKLHGDGAWERNDWVWVVSFKRLKP